MTVLNDLYPENLNSELGRANQPIAALRYCGHFPLAPARLHSANICDTQTIRHHNLEEVRLCLKKLTAKKP